MPDTLPEVAVIIVTPGAKALAKPCETNATAPFDEVQVAVEVMSSRVAPLEDIRMAVNCRLLPTGMEGPEGDMEIETVPIACGELTVSVV